MVITHRIREAKNMVGELEIFVTANRIYGTNMQEPTKHTNPIFLKNRKDFSFNKIKAITICMAHFPPAIEVESNICSVLIYSGHKITNHQVNKVDNPK